MNQNNKPIVYVHLALKAIEPHVAPKPQFADLWIKTSNNIKYYWSSGNKFASFSMTHYSVLFKNSLLQVCSCLLNLGNRSLTSFTTNELSSLNKMIQGNYLSVDSWLWKVWFDQNSWKQSSSGREFSSPFALFQPQSGELQPNSSV